MEAEAPVEVEDAEEGHKYGERASSSPEPPSGADAAVAPVEGAQAPSAPTSLRPQTTIPYLNTAR